MDIVITYVDGSDPLWQQDYQAAAGRDFLAKRYRDWDTLPFLLRGIERHLPFAGQVFLAVSRESQVPAWANPDHLKVVFHRDFIPQQCLPTFNSAAIELFLHRIPGLSERFLYLNDDIFPVADALESDFFTENGIATGFSRHLLATNQFKRHCRNADRLARQALGLPLRPFFLRPQHACMPMLKSACAAVFDRVQQPLLRSVTPLRADSNVNQYLYPDYLYLSGRALNRRISNRHISLGSTTPRRLDALIRQPGHQFLSINDVEMSQARFDAFRAVLLSAFAARFPEKSRYER